MVSGPGSAPISSFGYGYDAVGNIINWTQSQVSNSVLPTVEWMLAMDGSNQLTGITVTGQPALAEVFGYENGGNRLTRRKGNAVTTTTYNDLNQIESTTAGGKIRMAGTTSEAANVTVQGVAARMLSTTNFVANPSVNVGTNVIPVVATDGSGNSRTNNYQMVIPAAAARSFSYDNTGNLINDGLRAYEWDGLNRMVKVTQGADVYEFAYDGLSRMVSETKNSTLTRRFVWDGLALAEERDASNAATKRFFPQGEVQGTTSYFYCRDHLGSVREVTDSEGGIVASYSYDAWGKRTKLTAGAVEATFGYTGHYTHPEIDLVFAPFRAYDPETGRWLSRDPIGEEGGINLYGYVANNPVNLWDPLGLWIDVPDDIRNAYDQARKYLAGTPVGDKLDALDKLPQRIAVKRGNQVDKFSPSDNSITWDPCSALSTPDGRGLSPALILGHEADHALAFNTEPELFEYRTNPKTGALGGGWENREELRATVGAERATALMKGEGRRTDHVSGEFYKVGNVTSRSRIP